MSHFNRNRVFKALLAILFMVPLSSMAITTEPNVKKSRLAVVATETKTALWVSDFPKSTTVVLYDQDDNLLSVLSTNEYGAAYVAFPKAITTTVYAKTINGEILVCNKAEHPNKIDETMAAKAEVQEKTKA